MRKSIINRVVSTKTVFSLKFSLKKCIIKRIPSLTFVCICSCFFNIANGQAVIKTPGATPAQNNLKLSQTSKLDTTGNVVSNGHFSWIITGNAEQDALNMLASSYKFKIEHRDIYEKISIDTTKVTVLDEDLKRMPKERQDSILSHLDFYKIIKKN